jgi:hypothetical protein
VSFGRNVIQNEDVHNTSDLADLGAGCRHLVKRQLGVYTSRRVDVFS